MRLIDFNNVWEKYRVKFIHKKDIHWEEVWALRGISFEAEKGDIIGIIGRNGAGKTTLLRLIAGMLVPDKGEAEIRGKVSALMTLGAGFNPELTGIENIKLNAAIYGLSTSKLEQRISDIVGFAGLDKFIDAPIKYYSQGMYMRLAFALAIFTQPDILLIDDILSVGDEEAQQKCIKKVFDLKREGKTIILVSHDMGMVSKLCNKLILLDKGEIIRKGLPSKVIPYYLETVGEKNGIAVLEKEKLRVVFNNGKLAINYGDSLLTKEAGGYISFFMPSVDSWVPSFNLFWHVKNAGTDKIIAEGTTQEGDSLLLLIFWIEKNSLRWEVELQGEDIKQAHAALFLTCQYTRWHTLQEVSEFPLFVSKSNLHDLGLNSCPDAILGLSGALSNQECPCLIMENEKKDVLIKPLNAGYEQEARVLQWSLDSNSKNVVQMKVFADYEKFEKYLKDAKQVFLKHHKKVEQKLFLAEADKKQVQLRKQQAELARLRNLNAIHAGNLELFADTDFKALRLYYDATEITVSPGLHSSFVYEDNWYDLSSAEWKIEKKNNVLNLHFYWKKFDFTQIWQLYFQESSIVWHVTCQLGQNLECKQLKFGISVVTEYKNFFCGGQQDSFPTEFDIWQDMVLAEPKARLCGIRKDGNFPAVVLENNHNYTCIIQNSDKQVRYRVLQLGVLKKPIKQETVLFSASVYLLGDEAMVDDYLQQAREKFAKEQKEEQRLLQQKEEEQRILQQKEEEQRLLQQKEEEQRILKQKEEEQRILQQKEEEQRILKQKEEEQRLLRQKEEEQRILKQKEEEQRLLQQKEEEQRILQQKEEEQRLLQQKEEEQRLLQQKEEEQRLLAEQQADLTRLRDFNTIHSGSLKLSVDAGLKIIKLYYKDLEVTSKRGIYSVFNTLKDSYDFNRCTWNINKIAQNKIVLNVHYESIALLQIWHLACEEDNSLSVKIEVEAKRRISFVNQDIKIEVNDIFDSWATAHEKGNFDKSCYIGNMSPIALRDNKISQILLNFNKSLEHEQLFFATFSESEEQTVDLHKIREDGKEYIRINAPLILYTDTKLAKTGKRVYFDGRISFGESFQCKKNAKTAQVIEVEKKNIKVIFDSGRGRILYNGGELTTGLSLYSSVRSEGIWYDSYQAKWNIQRHNTKMLLATGDWPHIPISQTWKIVLSGQNVIMWKVQLIIHETVKLDFEQSNIMLCSKYKTWRAPNDIRGTFLDEYTQQYDILPFRFWYGKAREIAAQPDSDALPEISFGNDTSREDIRAIIENTDTLYKARLIQYQKENIADSLPGERPYFKGTIKIG